MWKDYLAFSKSERKAFWALSLLLMISATLLYAVKNSNWVDDSQRCHYNDLLYTYFDSINNENKERFQLFDTIKFDINVCSEEELEAVGLSINQIKNLTSYRIKGGQFKSVEDLKRIYSIDSLTFSRVCSRFVVKKTKYPLKDVTTKIKYKKPDFQVEINKSDTITLSLIPGIGSALSRRIVKYRDKIGGYYDIDQLSEVYGVSNELIAKISSFIIVDSSLIVPKNLNQLSIFQMKGHPYLDFYKTKEIIEYRKSSGSFNSIEQILVLKSFENCDKAKIKRYFIVK